MSASARIVSDQRASRGSALEVLAALHRVVPRSITLSGLTLEDDGRLTLRGTAPSLSATVDLVSRLERSKAFEAVELRSSNVLRINGKDMVEFQVEGRAS